MGRPLTPQLRKNVLRVKTYACIMFVIPRYLAFLINEISSHVFSCFCVQLDEVAHQSV